MFGRHRAKGRDWVDAEVRPTSTHPPSGAPVLAVRKRPGWARGHRFRLLVGLLLLLGVFLSVYRLLDTQPGFYRDESAISYNAYTIATGGVDEYGTPWPLFFRSFGDYKSAPFVYLMAVVFKTTGPSILAARVVAALLGLAGAVVLAWLAVRITGRRAIGLFVGATALLTPQLFETSRLVFEVVLVPVLLSLFLVLLQASPSDRRWSWRAVILLGFILSAITYAYALGRLLGPLLALGLVAYLRRATWVNVARTWAVYLAAVVPMGLYALELPESLSVRLQVTGYLNGLAPPDIAARFAAQYLANIDPRNLLLLGDPIQRHHVAGVMGSILAATLILAILGLDRIAHRLRADPWWRFVVYGLVVSIIPASLTTDVSHALRLIALPVFVIVLTIPALAWLLEKAARHAGWQSALALLVIATLVQGAFFQVRFHVVAPNRGSWFEQEFPTVFDEALATDADPIYVIDGVARPYILAYWYGVLRGVPASRFVHLVGGDRPPSGATVISAETDCGACQIIDMRGPFKVYRAP
jgi:hypothetical protein